MNKNFLSALEIAFDALKSNKIRTFLAVLGIMIGISSIVIVFSAGEGMSGLVLGQIESFGVDTIQVEIKMPSSKKGYASEQQSAVALLTGVQITTLKTDDIKDVVKLPNIADGYGLLFGQEQISYGNEARRTEVMGTSASYINIDQTEVQHGRYFSSSENNSMAQVVVLGSEMAERLFGESDPLGKSIKIRKLRFRVIGVMEERGAIMAMSFDDFIYIPIKTMQKKVMGVDFVHNLFFKVNDLSRADDTAEQIRIILRNNHDIPQPEGAREGWADTGKDDFRVMTMAEILDLMNNMTEILTILLIAIVAISLVVGGVGVMNIMYVIITERTGEIGLRKAVGAKYTDIMQQFLIESVLITFAGGIAGIIFGVVVSFLITIGASLFGLDWYFIVPLRAFIIALIFSVFFGIIFGLYPARKAAQMDPVEALRRRE